MLTKVEFKQFREDFAKAVEQLESEYNLDIAIGNISYDDTHFQTTMKCTMTDDTGNPVFNKDKFNQAKRILGFKPDVGDIFYCKNEMYTITDLILNRPKFPVQATRSDGKKFKFTIDTVHNCLKIR